jgi:hypothetical protein
VFCPRKGPEFNVDPSPEREKVVVFVVPSPLGETARVRGFIFSCD